MKRLSKDDLDEAPLPGDTQWLAIQFVLGELPPEQSEQFESAMAGDVSLCEAVIAATRLTAGITLACGAERTLSAPVVTTMPSSTDEPIRTAFAGTIVLGAALALALTVLGMVTLQQSPPVGKSSVTVDDAAADALALLLRNDSVNDSNNEFDDWSLSDDSISSLIAPEWLLTAVDLDVASKSDDHPVVRPDDES